MDQTSNSYDLVPYNSLPFKQTHPNRLATVATLMGLQPAPVATARVLELGCGCGDNLIPLGLELPDAELVGIDLSQRHVDMAAAAIAELGVGNVRINQGDILDLPANLGRFDYVIAHGVYSWLPDAVRDALMTACSAHLAPQGIAYVSYNALPGWRQRGIARDALLFHTRTVTDPAERIRESQAFIEFMGRVVPEAIPGYRDMWRTLFDRIETPAARDALVFHDFLEPDNTPVYFSQFVAHADRHDLRFVAEAKLSDMTLDVLGDEVRQRLSALDDDIVTREQYRDFIINRPFRQSLLCNTAHTPRVWPDPAAVSLMHVSSELRPQDTTAVPTGQGVAQFALDGTEVAVDRPIVTAALLLLGEQWPRPLPFDALLRRARARMRPEPRTTTDAEAQSDERRTLTEELLLLYQAELVDLDIAPPRFALEPGERPVASPWARRQGRGGGLICNLRHNAVELDPLAIALLPLLDGSRDHAALARALAQAATDEGLVVSEDGRAIEQPPARLAALEQRLPYMLRRFCQLALIIDSPGVQSDE